MMLVLGACDIDLFASYKNTQIEAFYSWRPDPKSLAVDALSQSWKGRHPYLFPPFSLIDRCLRKIKEEEVQAALLVAPLWPARTWFPLLLEMISDIPRLLPADKLLVSDPLGNPHPLQVQQRLKLVAWSISGSPLKHKELLERLPISTVPHGENQLHPLTSHAGRDGLVGVVEGRQIPLRPL